MTSVSIKTFTQSITMFPNPPYTAVAKKKNLNLTYWRPQEMIRLSHLRVNTLYRTHG